MRTGKTESEVGTLKSMLEYIEQVKKDVPGPEAQAHIEKDLVPYVESLRFPFTGTSTLKPYKPKLLP